MISRACGEEYFDSLGSSTASSADDDVMVDLMIDARIASSKSYEERINSLCSNQAPLEQSLSSKSMEIQSVKRVDIVQGWFVDYRYTAQKSRQF